MDKKTSVTILSKLWVLNGVIEFGLNMNLLKVIADKYISIGQVPSGYYQAMLFEVNAWQKVPESDLEI